MLTVDVATTGREQRQALVYAHVARLRYGANGSVTVFAANPSASTVQLQVALRDVRERVPMQLRVDGSGLLGRVVCRGL